MTLVEKIVECMRSVEIESGLTTTDTCLLKRLLTSFILNHHLSF